MKVPSGRLVVPPGSSRNRRGGNESAEAFDVKGSQDGDSANRRAVTRVNAEQASKQISRTPTSRIMREGRRRRMQRAVKKPRTIRCDGSAGVVATARLQGRRRNTGDPFRWRQPPTRVPRGTDGAGMGVGSAHSTDEAGNDRRGKGPKLKGQRRKRQGKPMESDASLEPPVQAFRSRGRRCMPKPRHCRRVMLHAKA